MPITVKNQEAFIIDANIRESYMNRVDVLEKVKDLLLLPNLEMATTNQVADFYETSKTVISTLVFEHREELLEDGYHSMKGKELKGKLDYQNFCKPKITNKKGHFTVEHGGQNAVITYGENGLFPRRAILRVGMLLRDSHVAKEVRTQLLNIEEKATQEVKVADINEEQSLQMAVGQAFMSGDINALAHASEKLIEFKSRHITEIENKLQEQKAVIQTLAKEEIQYKDPKKLLRKLVNRYSTLIHGTIRTNKGWKDLCSHLVNKLENGINLKTRRTIARKTYPRASYISVIRDEEFKIIIPAMVGMCESRGVNVSDIMKDAQEVIVLQEAAI
ncbi:hypothetical protein [Bacillus sp. XF8]|uniref:Uncharacterized protein n=1 Tax=Bacillus bingmayongensis TaxID=1150157 RepID=A0ABU5K259_9BACI|nr:hypothetical protein [Bacillus sp. XF8]MBO1582970.1 hypothetical protein [Bacillus sp. XF8]MDZ5609487.1 hypothetical protein [Bacillus pseudomycoides]